MLPISKVGGREERLTTTIPTEVAGKLGIVAGDELVWVEDGAGTYRVLRSRDAEIVRIHEEIIREYHEVFENLSKS